MTKEKAVDITAIALAAAKEAVAQAKESEPIKYYNTFYVILATLAIVVSASWFLYDQISTRVTDKRVSEIVSQGLADFKVDLMEANFTPLKEDIIKINTQLIYIAEKMEIKLLDLTTVQSLQDSLKRKGNLVQDLRTKNNNLVAETNKLQEEQKGLLNQIEQLRIDFAQGDETLFILAEKLNMQDLNRNDMANILYLTTQVVFEREHYALAKGLANEYIALGLAEDEKKETMMKIILEAEIKEKQLTAEK